MEREINSSIRYLPVALTTGDFSGMKEISRCHKRRLQVAGDDRFARRGIFYGAARREATMQSGKGIRCR